MKYWYVVIENREHTSLDWERECHVAKGLISDFINRWRRMQNDIDREIRVIFFHEITNEDYYALVPLDG